MIVHSMTELEFQEEIYEDAKNVAVYSRHLVSRFRRIVIKSKHFPVIKEYDYLSPQNNRWVIQLEAKSKKETGRKSRMGFFCYFDSSHGYYVVSLTVAPSILKRKHQLVLYIPHFFSRYAERNQVEKTGVELIRHYFKKNENAGYHIEGKQLSDTTYERTVSGSTAEGVALGFISGHDTVFFKTFISHDMAKGEQVETFAASEYIRREIQDTYNGFN